jgi:hypothetical protein
MRDPSRMSTTQTHLSSNKVIIILTRDPILVSRKLLFHAMMICVVSLLHKDLQRERGLYVCICGVKKA